jgi:O-antigen ligase
VARKTLLYILTFNVWCVVAGALIIAAERERAVRFFVFSLGLAVVLALIGLYIDSHFGSFRYWQGWRELGIRRVYLGWGYTIADGAGVLLALTLFARFGTLRQLTAAAGLTVCLAFLMVGGARGPFLGVVLAAIVALVARPPRIGRYRLEIPPTQLLGVLALVLGGVAVLYLLGSGEAPLTLQRLQKALAMAFEEDARAPISLGADRLDYWPAAVAAWLEAPFAGHGISGFNVWYRGQELEGAHPHNILLQTLADLGLVGLVLLLLFFWSGLRNVRLERLREDPLFALALIFFVTGIMNGMFAKDLAGARKAFFVVGLLALARPAAAATRPSPAAFVVQTRPFRSTEALRRPVS